MLSQRTRSERIAAALGVAGLGNAEQAPRGTSSDAARSVAPARGGPGIKPRPMLPATSTPVPRPTGSGGGAGRTLGSAGGLTAIGGGGGGGCFDHRRWLRRGFDLARHERAHREAYRTVALEFVVACLKHEIARRPLGGHDAA